MSEPTGTLARALREAAAVVASLGDELADEASALALLDALGVAAPEAPPSLLAARDAVDGVQTAAAELGEAIATSGEGSFDAVAKLAALSARSAEAFATLSALPPRLESDLAAYPALVAEVDFGALVDRLVTRLVATHLRRRAPFVYNTLALLGVADPEVRDAEGAYGRQHVRDVLRWERLGQAGEDPGALMAAVYDWGTDRFDAGELLRRLHYLLMSAGLSLELLVAGEESPLDTELRLALLSETGEQGSIEVGLALGTLPPTATSATGLGLRPYALGSAAAQIEPRPGLRVRLEGGFQGAGGLVLGLRPPFAPELLVTNGGSAALGLAVEWARSDAAPVTLVRQPDWFVIELGGLAARLDATLATTGAATLSAAVTTVGARLRLKADEGDGFLRQILPSDGITAEFNLNLTCSPETGLRFMGSGGFDVELPLHLSIAGVLNVEGLHIALRAAAEGGLRAAAAATFSVHLGPIAATVERMGFELALEAPPERGNLGPFQLDTRFKPPSGAALSIDAGPVTGGGFLFFDPAREQYAGGLHLEFEKLTLDAIGLLTTRMPDGSRGFSLLVMVRASGFAPIPLGFGFSLTGVGGLLGINRTVAVDVLRAGVRNRTLDSILFSKDDPTPRAPQIVSTLQTVFPPASGRYVFGPMAQIGWGPPNAPVLLIEVALLLELPAPLRLIILGRIRAGLPQPDKAIVKLNLDVVGIIDFDRRELSVDATLFDSFVGPFALTGDMAARANWGERPDFALSLGGFHPAFKPPAGFPALRRLALTLSTRDNPRLRMEAYLALTSNTVQLGARLDFYVAVAGFSLEGGFGFDALIQLAPFRLQAELDAGLTLKKGSRTLMHLGIHVNIVGPSPWEVWGEAKFKLLFISITVPFRARFGRPEALPEAERTDVWALLSGELAKPENWRSELPAADNRLATLIGEPAAGEALVHPLGALTVNQRSVPLERTLSMFGTAPPREASRFEITGATGLQQGGDLYDWFAPAQFRRMTDAEKLASPAFDRMVSGAALGPSSGTVAMGHVQPTPLDYETIVVVDLDDPVRETADDYVPSADEVGTLAERGPAAVAELRDQGRAEFAPETAGPAVGDPEYVVATRDTLRVTAATAHDGSYSGAVETLRSRADADRLQVVRREETELVPA